MPISVDFKTVKEQEREIVRVANRILNREVGIVEGVREISRTRFRSHANGQDKDYLLLVGIESETQQFPLGAIREKWDSHALDEKDRERERYEMLRRDLVDKACAVLIARYGLGLTNNQPVRR